MPEAAVTVATLCAPQCQPHLLPATFLIVLCRACLIGAWLFLFFLVKVPVFPFSRHWSVLFIEQGFVRPEG